MWLTNHYLQRKMKMKIYWEFEAVFSIWLCELEHLIHVIVIVVLTDHCSHFPFYNRMCVKWINRNWHGLSNIKSKQIARNIWRMIFVGCFCFCWMNVIRVRKYDLISYIVIFNVVFNCKHTNGNTRKKRTTAISAHPFHLIETVQNSTYRHHPRKRVNMWTKSLHC